ncbi:hypothetical protein F8388_027208 [Cannabis sativa]|uniref:Uncharacterized protein n=1 Tax=Cannabis sativa TaxID=3483 RepID=A0A7J6FPE0_CANSA|nr:hypothetical protein F8388_027208 [Cannabis sativa]
MVELQSCASLVNTSALCAIEQEVKGENANVIAQISAELQKERQKNAELMKRISFLEAQIQERTKEYSLCTNLQGSCATPRETNFKKFKKQKIEAVSNGTDTDKTIKNEDSLEKNQEAKCLVQNDQILENRSGSISHSKKPPKVAFCPREVKRIIVSEALEQKNAQSHTIRKIIVFASLGIRHGCEDMYELDFNHFSILKKGEPYESPSNPGEHVLYENPQVRRKVFYPNRQNPTLCPIQVLEEEKAMRPSDSSCPSCLFLCIKYVRQRMGRNKLKSFGPLICRMAMLAHVRSGSFFFKALGITLLFMAGFPDDLVQRETKYRNLDLLQKYYRTDEEAEGEELFLQHPIVSDSASPGSQQLTGKTCSTKPKVKKQTNSNSNSKPHNHNTQRSSTLPKQTHVNSGPPAQFGLMGYTSIHTQAMTAYHHHHQQQQQPQTPLEISNSVIPNSATNVIFPNQTPYHHHHHHTLSSPQPTNPFVPALMYWPPPNTYPPATPYTPTYGYHQSFPSAGNYISIHPQPYYTPLIPKIVEGDPKIDTGLKDDANDSDSSSSSTEPKKED